MGRGGEVRFQSDHYLASEREQRAVGASVTHMRVCMHGICARAHTRNVDLRSGDFAPNPHFTSNRYGFFDILSDEAVRQGLKEYSKWVSVRMFGRGTKCVVSGRARVRGRAWDFSYSVHFSFQLQDLSNCKISNCKICAWIFMYTSFPIARSWGREILKWIPSAPAQFLFFRANVAHKW